MLNPATMLWPSVWGACTAFGKAAGLKSFLVLAARPVVRVTWPVIEASARADAGRRRPKHIETQVFSEWNEELDQLLEQLPEPPMCSRNAYRQLCLPAECPKKHIVLRENGQVIALLSLRRRKDFWEPVTYQALRGFIAPARDFDAVVQVLHTAGMEISIAAGLGGVANELGAHVVYSFEYHVADLTSDHEEHWMRNKRRHFNSVSKARRKCKNFEVAVDRDGDIEWGLNTWRDMWKDDPEDEVCAFCDRLRLWTALREEASAEPGHYGLRTVSVRDGDRIAACVIFVAHEDKLFWQCTSRDLAYNKHGVGTFALDAALRWAKEQGYKTVDLSGGAGFKADWAPVAGERFGAIIRPAPIRFFRKFNAR